MYTLILNREIESMHPFPQILKAIFDFWSTMRRDKQVAVCSSLAAPSFYKDQKQSIHKLE